jgi:hypothetical protein
MMQTCSLEEVQLDNAYVHITATYMISFATTLAAAAGALNSVAVSLLCCCCMRRSASHGCGAMPAFVTRRLTRRL